MRTPVLLVSLTVAGMLLTACDASGGESGDSYTVAQCQRLETAIAQRDTETAKRAVAALGTVPGEEELDQVVEPEVFARAMIVGTATSSLQFGYAMDDLLQQCAKVAASSQ